VIAALTGVAAICVGVAWVVFGPLAPPRVTPIPPPVQAPPARPGIALATERQIAAHAAERLTLYRYADNPLIVIIDFPSLRDQGLTLNRIAAFVEKASLPRDRVLNQDELAAEIARGGDTVDSYYYGHDYAIADLLRFFNTAARDNVPLGPEEARLYDLIRQEGLDDPARPQAIITVPRVTPDAVDARTRAVILRHELSHGEFFTNPAYAAYVRQAWDTILTGAERAAFRAFLQGQNYDITNHDLTVNEMQAFLVFTPDDRYASAATLGLPAGDLERLQLRFVDGMPEGWLKTLARMPLP
jgi:hypothetical protein